MSIARVHGFLLICFMKRILTPITNRQNPSIFQNKKGIGSRPDPFQGGAYNLQSISATMRKRVWFTRLIVLVDWRYHR